MTNEPTPPSGLSPAAIAALWKGQMIEAIKVVRQEQNLGLKEAKDAVDAYLKTQPGPEEKNGDGASGAEAGLCPLACCGCDSSSPRCLLALDARGIVGRNNPERSGLAMVEFSKSAQPRIPCSKNSPRLMSPILSMPTSLSLSTTGIRRKFLRPI